MAKTINLMKSNSIPTANAGMKLSKIILVEKIEPHEKFQKLFKIDENTKQRIAESMKVKLDASQPIHIWKQTDDDGTEHLYLIDGYTRVAAAKEAGITSLPYFEHDFENFEDCYKYVLGLQVNRRNLSGADLLTNLSELMGTDYVNNISGNKNAAIGEMLGVSEKTIERAKFVEKNATEEQKKRIESGESTVNQINEEIKQEKKAEQNRQMSVEDEIENEDFEDENEKSSSGTSDFDDIDESLGSNEGTPSGLNFSHSDGIERPSYKLSKEEDEERTYERKISYREGYAKGFYEAFCFAIGEIKKGRTPDEVVADERVSDFSACAICDFVLPEEDEDLMLGFSL